MSLKLLLALVTGLAVGSIAYGQATPGTSAPVPSASTRDVRYVVMHTPGPRWEAGKGMFDQPGIRDHVEHYRKWLQAGKLDLGGPHLDARGGGMMIPVAGLALDEITKFAEEDPAVKSGLLVAVVRPWLIGMRKQ